MLEVLHVTAHLGGGVGKVLSRVAAAAARGDGAIRHTIACLERLEKDQFAAHIRAHGGVVHVEPDDETLRTLVARSDVVQVEWWSHPVLMRWLCASPLPEMRMIVWSHVSGLHPPVIPPDFLAAPHRFLFTSPCSLAHPNLRNAPRAIRSTTDAVFSSGGFDDLPLTRRRFDGSTLRAGYVGTLNYAKLHPRFLDYVEAVRLPEFRVRLIGDASGATALRDEARQRGLHDRLELHGYCTDVAAQLEQLDVLVYLLNPLHYGTTENALLEAMAMGVVPIVLPNPAERELIRHGENGMIVDTPSQLAAALDTLAHDPGLRARLSRTATTTTRERFSIAHTVAALDRHYRGVAAEPKRRIDLRPVFGATAAQWFRASQGAESWRFPVGGNAVGGADAPHFLFERTKGSVFHYHSAFPEDAQLRSWADSLREFS